MEEKEIWTVYHERWLVNQCGPIKLFAVYEVSDQGRIRINGKIKELPDIPNNDFYLGAPASYNGKRMRLHQLVATIYVHNDDPINKTQIDHIDGNKANNRADNLRWVSPKQNMNNDNTLVVMKTAYKTIWIHLGDEEMKITRNELDKYISQGWQKGKINKKQKHSSQSHFWVHLGDEQKFVEQNQLDDLLSKGWELGMKPSKFYWIHLGNETKFVHEDYLDYWLDDGWELGRKKKKQI